MAFDTVNNRRSARRRYAAPRLASEGAGFDQGDRQQVRWLYRGLLLPTTVLVPGRNTRGTLVRRAKARASLVYT